MTNGRIDITVGDAGVTRIVESVDDLAMTPAQFLPNYDREAWERGGAWTEPAFLVPGSGTVHDHTHRSAMQTWLVRVDGKVVLIDTAIGNAKERPYIPSWSHLSNDYLDRLAGAGVAPEDVDFVVNTHLHPDHVGWNTVLHEREWVPTFPNATYYLPEADVEFWDPANKHDTVLGRGAQNVWEDSIAPVLSAGRAVVWRDTVRVTPSLALETAPGHTPGASIARLTSGGHSALFIGDTLHSPFQVESPATTSCFCENPSASRANPSARLRRGRAGEPADVPGALPGARRVHRACGR
ncbi:MAG: putative metallo-beta-lactamase family protein [Pseudonocardiales bacterium]|nr:putative metallo-beta-lactamase family protein [Pseudonocardiales bacterium]